MNSKNLFNLCYLFVLSILFIGSVSGQEGFISEKHQRKIDNKTERESKSYNKSNYQVYNSDLSLTEAIREFYQFQFTEIKDDLRKYVTPVAMSREKNLEEAVEKGEIKVKNSALGIMQLYYNSWIYVDDRTTQDEKNLLVKALEKAEPAIKEMIDSTDPIKDFILYKEMKRGFRVEYRRVYDQEEFKANIRKLLIKNLEEGGLFEGKDINQILTFEK